MKKEKTRPQTTEHSNISNSISNLRVPVSSRNTKEHKTFTSGSFFPVKLILPAN